MIKKKLFKKVFSIENVNIHKILTVLGVKIKIKNKRLILQNEFNSLAKKLKLLEISYEETKKDNKIKQINNALVENIEIYKKNKNAKILIVLHLYYMEQWETIKEYLENISVYDYDLIITCINEHYEEETLNQIKKYKPYTKIYKYDNKGFDIGSFIDILNKINLEDYDVVYKLHSKGWERKNIYIYKQIFKRKDWFYNLYNGILGESAVHIVIDKLLNHKKIGIVAANNLIINDPKHKQVFTKKYADKFNISIKDNYRYIAGSCFAIKAECLKNIKNMHFTIDDFETVERGTFSFAHAMERLVCANVETQGYDFYGIDVKCPKYELELEERNQNSALRLLEDENFEIDNEFFYKFLETRSISNYRVKYIKLKDIKRVFDQKECSLSEVSPYKYLMGDIKGYLEYCSKNKNLYNWDMTEDRFKDLISSISKHGYNNKFLPIIDEENIILDGQHRCCILLYKYGPDYEIPVLEIKYKK